MGNQIKIESIWNDTSLVDKADNYKIGGLVIAEIYTDQNMELLLRLYWSLSELRWRLALIITSSLLNDYTSIDKPSNYPISERYNYPRACILSPSSPSHSCIRMAKPSPSPPEGHRINSQKVILPSSKLSLRENSSWKCRGLPTTLTLEVKISGTTNSR